MATRTLLLIDDDRLPAKLIEGHLRQFRGERYEMLWRGTYEEGLVNLRQGRHAVCLLDYQLGPRDGLELLREAQQAGCTTPIVFLTAEAVREVDVVARIGGEESALLLLEQDEGTARSTLERVLTAQRATPVSLPEGPALTVTMSAGAAALRVMPEDPAALMAAADGALYAAKRGGRDRVVSADAGAAR